MNDSTDSVGHGALRGPDAGRARVLIKRLGATYAVVLGTYLLASPVLAAAAPRNVSASRWGPEGLGVLSWLPLPDFILAALRGEGPVATPRVFGLTYASLVLVSTFLWLTTLRVVQSHRDAITDSLVSSVFRWSMVFTAVLVLATPILVHDFWLSVAWGRVVAAGLNPYYTLPTFALADLPLRRSPGSMTYGPLWALISGGTSALAGGSALATAALQKVVIAVAWAAAVRTVFVLTRHQPAATRCTAVVLLGWSPLGLMQGVADGHNDVLLVLPMLLWLLFVERGAPYRSALALAMSVSIKYVTAPLFALHVARAFVERDKTRAWLGSLGAAAALGLGVLAVFYRSPEFFAATRNMQGWRFLTPSALVESFSGVTGVPLGPLPRLIDVAFGVAAAVAVWRWIRSPSAAAFRAAALWTMCAALLGMVGHVWPWFVLWVLALAAIQPHTRLASFVVGLAAAAPFALLPWATAPGLDRIWRFGAPGVVLYLAAVGGMLLGGMLLGGGGPTAEPATRVPFRGKSAT